jgi:hypothetical protein
MRVSPQWAIILIGWTVIACSPPRPLVMDSGNSVDASRTCTRNEDCNDNTTCTRDLCLVGGVCENSPDHSMCPSGQRCLSGLGCSAGTVRTCTSPTDCDDRIDCTRDTCLVDGTCRNQPDDAMCPMGQRCNAMNGCGTSPSRCMNNGDCDDRIDCTLDTCTVSGTCEHIPQNTRCSGGRTCNARMGCIMETACRGDAECDDGVYCNGAETCNTELACVAGTPVNCADSDPCTIDTCDEAMRRCTNMRDPACMGSTVRSGIYDVSTPITYACTDIFLGMTAINLGIDSFQLTVIGASITVVGRNTSGGSRFGTPTMTGTVMGTSFSATGVRTGDCPETYTLTGNFVDADNFAGTLRMTLMGVTCGLTNCTNQEWPVRGTYRM